MKATYHSLGDFSWSAVMGRTGRFGSRPISGSPFEVSGLSGDILYRKAGALLNGCRSYASHPTEAFERESDVCEYRALITVAAFRYRRRFCVDLANDHTAGI